jgi:hypothetical protein
MLSQIYGTLAKPVEIGLTDGKHYRIPMPTDATTVASLLVLLPPPATTTTSPTPPTINSSAVSISATTPSRPSSIPKALRSLPAKSGISTSTLRSPAPTATSSSRTWRTPFRKPSQPHLQARAHRLVLVFLLRHPCNNRAGLRQPRRQRKDHPRAQLRSG